MTLFNNVAVSTATTGQGTVTLGGSISNKHYTFSEAGVTNGATVSYKIEQGDDFEISTGIYTSAGSTLTRGASTVQSKIAGVAGTTKLTLTGSATVRIVARAEDLGGGTGSPGGSNTQVQFNNSSSFDGSADLTWVDPALQIGSGATSGALKLYVASGTGTVTLKGPSTFGITSSYSLEFPQSDTGVNGATLVGDGSGHLSWGAAVPAGPGGADGDILLSDGAAGFKVVNPDLQYTGGFLTLVQSGGHFWYELATEILTLSRVLLLEDDTFASLPASPVTGMIAAISDSDTDVWGATITSSSPANKKVMGFYNGTNWTVMGK